MKVPVQVCSFILGNSQLPFMAFRRTFRQKDICTNKSSKFYQITELM